MISILVVRVGIEHMLEHMFQNILREFSMHCCRAKEQGSPVVYSGGKTVIHS